MKSEKLSDLLMFRNNQKKLCSFVIKLCLKLQENTDQYFTEWNKMNYIMFWLEKNAANIMNFFYCNESLVMLESLIILLKQTYDDASHKYTAMTKFETL